MTKFIIVDMRDTKFIIKDIRVIKLINVDIRDIKFIIYKLVSYERAVKILKNDTCITEIGQTVLEIFEFRVEFPRKIPKIRNFAIVSIVRVKQ